MCQFQIWVPGMNVHGLDEGAGAGRGEKNEGVSGSDTLNLNFLGFVLDL